MRALLVVPFLAAALLSSPANPAPQYTYAPLPTVASISPTAGPVAGGTSVTLTGTGFVAGATVAFGATQSPTVTVVSATQITAVSPPGVAGTVPVTVTTAGGTSL